MPHPMIVPFSFFRNGWLHTLRFGFGTGVFAKEVILLGSRQAGMAVSGAYQAELVRVGAKPFFKSEPAFQSFAGVLAGEHVVSLNRRHGIEITDIPGFIIGKFVIWRKKRMCFAVALDLGHFVERFPF